MVSHPDGVPLVLNEKHFVEIAIATDRSGWFPGEARFDYLPRFHFTAVAKFYPEPFVGGREARVVGRTNSPNADRRSIESGHSRVARR